MKIGPQLLSNLVHRQTDRQANKQTSKVKTLTPSFDGGNENSEI